jgi:type I restriction enzyme S subunit
MKSEWQTVRAADFMDFNPRLSIKKGTVATKISMDKLRPFTKAVPSVEQAEFSGGTKFANGDTIMARITPCLENGKTAFVDCLRENEIAFGSTEFIVLRAKPGVSDPQFVYYLATSPEFRNVAIKSMVGSSGRQRVQQPVLENLELTVPKLPEQEKIGHFLAELDDKIALNERVNDNLEQQAQAIFKEWFIENPENNEWSTGTFSELIKTTLNGDWGKEAPIGNNAEKVYCIRGADIPEVKAGNKGKMPTRYILPKNFVTKQLTAGDIVVEISGGSPTQSTGRCTAITQSLLDRYDSGMVCTNFCKAIKPKEGYSLFIYYYWQYLYSKGIFFSYENGTTGIKNLDLTRFS